MEILSVNFTHLFRGALDIVSGRIVTKSYYPAGYLLLSCRIPDNSFSMKCTKFP
jgi:hypothetical protein